MNARISPIRPFLPAISPHPFGCSIVLKHFTFACGAAQWAVLPSPDAPGHEAGTSNRKPL